MKHIIASISLLCSLSLTHVVAQDNKSFIEHFNMLLEVGLAQSTGDAFDNGLYFKTCLEYRKYKNSGWCAELEYGEYELGYHDYQFEGVNAIDGKLSSYNLFIGGGYRFAFTEDKKTDETTPVSSR